MGIKQLYNDNLRKLPNEYGDVSVMGWRVNFSTFLNEKKNSNFPKFLIGAQLAYKINPIKFYME